jgi:hypothetical protein
MRFDRWTTTLVLGLATVAVPMRVSAQDHAHVPGMTHTPDMDRSDPPTSSGQAAFEAIREIVARLDADPNTDWATVNVEALRLHLVDMDNVVMRSRIVARDVPGGFTADVTGEGVVGESIRRMLTAHVAQMATETGLKGTVEPVAGGARFTVVAADANDARAVARLRGLGTIGILTLGDHHGPHHEMMARGAMAH